MSKVLLPPKKRHRQFVRKKSVILFITNLHNNDEDFIFECLSNIREDIDMEEIVTLDNRPSDDIVKKYAKDNSIVHKSKPRLDKDALMKASYIVYCYANGATLDKLRKRAGIMEKRQIWFHK